jgi:hypothetical protein
MPDDDELEACSVIDFADDPTTDDELPYVVLFASVDESHRGLLGRREHRHDVEQLAEEWLELFGRIDA